MAVKALVAIPRRTRIPSLPTSLLQAFRFLSSNSSSQPYFDHHHHHNPPPFTSQPLVASSASASAGPRDDVNEICRVISDNRGLHHDLELALAPFSSRVSNELVEQVLKRTKNLGFAAHRFFVWAKRFPGFQPDFVSYKILIGILGSNRRFPLIWDLLSELRDSNGFRPCPDFFWFIFDAYCRAHSPGDAIRAFNRMEDFGLRPTGNDLDHLMYLLCRNKYVRNAQEFFDKVKLIFAPTVKTYSILIRGWGKIGDSESARRMFDEMLQRGCAADVPAYNSLLEALCNGGNVDEAYVIFRDMRSRGVKPDACSFSLFIRAYCEGDNVFTAFKVLDWMKRYNLTPNVYTYNSMIKRLCTNEKIDEAYHLLDEMVARGVNPDEWSYNTLMAFHCRRCEVNRAMKLISRMDKEEKCSPDRHTYNMLLKTLFWAGRFDKVQQLWDSMETRGFCPSVSTYAVMIHGFLKKHRKVEEACRCFEIMIDEGIPPYTSTCKQLRNRLVGLGLVEMISVLADKMERSSSISIREMAGLIRGDRIGLGRRYRARTEEHDAQQRDEEWITRWG